MAMMRAALLFWRSERWRSVRGFSRSSRSPAAEPSDLALATPWRARSSDLALANRDEEDKDGDGDEDEEPPPCFLPSRAELGGALTLTDVQLPSFALPSSSLSACRRRKSSVQSTRSWWQWEPQWGAPV